MLENRGEFQVVRLLMLQMPPDFLHRQQAQLNENLSDGPL
jgi:hypothetical protein